jgi:molybdate transport system substrate-binding protein
MVSAAVAWRRLLRESPLQFAFYCLVAGLLLPLSGCGLSPKTAPASDSPASELIDQAKPTTETVALTVSAAASLQNALTEINALFEQAHPTIEVSLNSGGSGSLQRQIEQGAPVDVFLSAGATQMDELAEQGKLRLDSRQDLLANQLVLIAPLESALGGFQDLSQAAEGDTSAGFKLAVGEFKSVPAGQYAEATLTSLKLLPQLQPNLVFFGTVRGALAAVESAQAEAGIVYKTDALLSKTVKVVAIAPDNSHPPIRYAIAILQRSEEPEAAQTYIDFLTGPEATQVFQRLGFIPLAKTP